MEHGIFASLLAVGLFLGMLTLSEVGRRIGLRRLAQDPEGAEAGVGVVDGAVFALLGLLMAFTFSGAALRFDTRRVYPRRRFRPSVGGVARKHEVILGYREKHGLGYAGHDCIQQELTEITECDFQATPKFMTE